MKSQRKAGDPPPETPGASIEAYFKPIQIMVDGQPGSRPIDQLLANLNELYRQLVLGGGESGAGEAGAGAGGRPGGEPAEPMPRACRSRSPG